MEKLTITIQVDKAYGGFLFYPICEKAKTFAKLTKTKTLSYDAIKHIKELSYEVVSKDMSYPVEAI
jgi:proline racemase